MPIKYTTIPTGLAGSLPIGNLQYNINPLNGIAMGAGAIMFWLGYVFPAAGGSIFGKRKSSSFLQMFLGAGLFGLGAADALGIYRITDRLLGQSGYAGTYDPYGFIYAR